MPERNWVLREEAWTVEALRIVAPGSRHSILLFWTAGFREFLLWYVNLEDPMVRTPIGFDYLDRLLDIEIAPDLSRWKWKDEDELEEAVAHGILTSQEAHVIRAEGESCDRSVGCWTPSVRRAVGPLAARSSAGLPPNFLRDGGTSRKYPARRRQLVTD